MPGIFERYRKFLPVTPRTPVITLNEGGTPLIAADRLAKKIGLPKGSLYLKFEGANPTGSFKDRGMTMAVSKALEEKAKAVICASTGNTAASASAYAAHAGLPCYVLLPAGQVAPGKLAQALMHGARVIQVRGNFDVCLNLVTEAAPQLGFTIVNSTNPYRLEGQKTAAFEICEEMGRAPDYQFMPVGNAGNITAYWKGYKEWKAHRKIKIFPRMMGFQATGAAPLVLGRPVLNPQTIATAIRIGNPASWQGALRAKEESGGAIDAVSDREILAAYRLVAELEGVFSEPSSAAGVAGLIRYAKKGFFRNCRSRRLAVVCILTGHGLKDPETPKRFGYGIVNIAPTLRSLRAII